jgi:two-component system sensor histidine kinase ChvG
MRSILGKILGLLFALNLALWLFVFISDDFVPNQVENKRNELNLSAVLYSQIALPVLLNEDFSEFEKSVELERLFTNNKIPNYEHINIFRYQEEGEFIEWFRYFEGRKATPPKPIEITELPPMEVFEVEVKKPEKVSTSNQLASYVFQYYKPIVDRRILTEPLVEKRSRFSAQEEILDSNLDAYFLRVLHPVRNGRETLAVVEVFDEYYIRNAYVGRNSIRLNLLIGMSVMTLVLGLVLAISIAFPLRRLSRKLDKKLTPDDIAVQLQGFRIESLLKRKDEIGRLHSNLVKLTQQVSSLFKEKEQFAAEVSHELKNPIASIIAYAENYEDQVSKDPNAIIKIKDQAIRMSKLVTEISEAAIVDNDLVTKKRERFDLSKVVDEIVEHYVDNNEFPGLKIISEVQSKVMLIGLPDRIGQVLVNLLDNAVSFTRPEGDIKVTLTKKWRKPVTLIIEDSGPGIRPELKDIIFDRFYTSRHGSAIVENASGLGLAISKQIIEAHGGTISTTVSQLRGAAFKIEF